MMSADASIPVWCGFASSRFLSAEEIEEERGEDDNDDDYDEEGDDSTFDPDAVIGVRRIRMQDGEEDNWWTAVSRSL